MTVEKFRALSAYSACDVADALLKLGVRKAGYIGFIAPMAPHGRNSPELLAKTPKVIAPASTVQFVHKSTRPEQQSQSVQESLKKYTAQPNIPAGTHWVDATKPDTIVVMSVPSLYGQFKTSAVLGGIMGLRMKKLGALGVVCPGLLIRDVDELQALDMPIWAFNSGIVGSGLDYKPNAIDIPVTVAGGVTIHPGDIVFMDPTSGVVVIPKAQLDEVLKLLPRLTEADEKVKEAVRAGSSVHDAFAKFRSNL